MSNAPLRRAANSAATPVPRHRAGVQRTCCSSICCRPALPVRRFDVRSFPMTVTVTCDGARVALSCPWDPQLPARARELGGRWDPTARVWAFDVRDEPRVRGLARDVYGSDGSDADAPGLSMRVDLGALGSPYGGDGQDRVALCGHTLARRPARDAAVRLSEGVVVVAGAFESWAGSMANPAIGDRDGVVLEWRDVPAGTAQRALAEHPGAVTLVDAALDRVALAAERDRLLARVGEIDHLLGLPGQASPAGPAGQEPTSAG